MAALDPALGSHNTWRGDRVERSATPTLYQSEGSYYSQIARLGLVEKGAPWKSRLLDLHSVALEQARMGSANDSRCGAQPWFLQLNPEGTVPVLVRTPEGAEKDEVVAGSGAILAWLDVHVPGPALSPPPGSAPHAAMRKLLELHAAVDAEEVCFAFGGLVTRAQVSTSRLRAVAARLQSVAQDDDAPGAARHAAAQRAERLTQRAARWADWDAHEGYRADIMARVTALLDELEKGLSAVGSGPFAVGAQYTLADVALTVFLTLCMRHGPTREALLARPNAHHYLRDVLSQRPSYAAADIWTGARVGKGPALVAAALAGPFAALGSALHKHVAVPIANTETYKAAVTALIDFQNDHRVSVEEEVKPAIAAGTKRYVVDPAVAAAAAIKAAVLEPAAEAGAAAGAALQVHVVAPVASAAAKAGEYVEEKAKEISESPTYVAASHAVGTALAPVAEAGKKTATYVGEKCVLAGAAVEAGVTPIANGTFDFTVVRVA